MDIRKQRRRLRAALALCSPALTLLAFGFLLLVAGGGSGGFLTGNSSSGSSGNDRSGAATLTID